MFKDTQEELQRLQEQLLEDEETKVLPNVDSFLKKQDLSREDIQDEDSLEDIADLLNMDEEELESLLKTREEPTYRNFSNGYGNRPVPAYNGDKENIDIYSDDDVLGEEIRQKPQSLRGLILTALGLLAGIAAVLLWWVVRYF